MLRYIALLMNIYTTVGVDELSHGAWWLIIIAQFSFSIVATRPVRLLDVSSIFILGINMASSGVKSATEVLDEFQKLSTKHQYRYIIFKINDEQTQIVVEKTGDKEKTFEDFKSDLPKDKCRYAVFDLNFETKEKQKREKVIFISHSPDNYADGKEKMIYSSSKKALLDKIGSGAVHAKFHYGDRSDIDLEEIVQEMRTKFK